MVNILSLQKPLDDIWNFLYGIKCTFIKDKTYQLPCEPVLTPWTHQYRFKSFTSTVNFFLKFPSKLGINCIVVVFLKFRFYVYTVFIKRVNVKFTLDTRAYTISSFIRVRRISHVRLSLITGTICYGRVVTFNGISEFKRNAYGGLKNNSSL